MKYILALFTILSLSGSLQADTKLGVMGSLLYNVADNNDTAGVVEENSKLGFGLGMRALMGLTDNLFFRSGAGLVQKNIGLEVEAGALKGDYNFSFTYLNLPATLYHRASPQVGFFWGTAINAKLDDSCKGTGNLPRCPVEDEASIVLPAIVGFEFVLSERSSLEISYEHGIMKAFKDTKISSAIASFIYNLE